MSQDNALPAVVNTHEGEGEIGKPSNVAWLLDKVGRPAERAESRAVGTTADTSDADDSARLEWLQRNATLVTVLDPETGDTSAWTVFYMNPDDVDGFQMEAGGSTLREAIDAARRGAA